MTVGMRFTDGTTTVTVSNGTTGYLLAYRTKSRDDQAVDDAGVLLLGGLSSIRSTVISLNNLFRQAKRRDEEHLGPRVFVERDLGDGTWWRSEIVEAAPLPEPDAWDIGIASGKMQINLMYSRKNWWEGSRSAVLLSNSTGSDLEMTIYNRDDDLVDNWVQITGSGILGDLPAPAELQLTNQLNHAYLLYDIWIGHNHTDPTNFSPVLEAEDATGGTLQTSASASGGEYKSFSLASGTETELLTWTLAGSLLNAAKGGLFKFMLAYFSALSSEEINLTKLRIKIKYQNTLIWQSGQVLPDQSRSMAIIDVATFRLPPWLQYQTSLREVSLILTGEQNSGVSKTLYIDYAMLMPLDGWRYITAVGYGAAYTERIVDDGIEGDLYMDNGSGANKIGIFNGYGRPIHLEPGKDQRLYFMQHDNVLFSQQTGRLLKVKVYHRPRRLTL